MTSKQQAIDTIMDCFDFGKVLKVMQSLDWKWVFVGGVPEEHELRQHARRFLKMAVEDPSDDFLTGSGGFVVRKLDGVLSLEFVVSDWQTDLEFTGQFGHENW